MDSENNGQDNGRDDKGKFLPGNPGKPKGSSKNKLRDSIKSFLNENWVNFPTWFEGLKNKEKIQTVLDLLPYAVPRLQSVSMTDTEGNDIPKGATIDYTKLSEGTLKEILAATNMMENGRHDDEI